MHYTGVSIIYIYKYVGLSQKHENKGFTIIILKDLAIVSWKYEHYSNTYTHIHHSLRIVLAKNTSDHLYNIRRYELFETMSSSQCFSFVTLFFIFFTLLPNHMHCVHYVLMCRLHRYNTCSILLSLQQLKKKF